MEKSSAPAESSDHPPLNRRRHPRYLCEGTAEVMLPNGGLLLRGRILDLSLSGCFIETPALNLERGTHVEVCFVARRLKFRVAGRIAVLHRRRGAGIAFLNLSERNAVCITELVQELKELSDKS